eukprot:TRINITY_DN204_c0_g1_i3.p1 TRINITY_DN204_c0_g1~~TRINITY_DN204_c0_g1_i3.p1  ORF type:complete len:278 (+),score=13.45 TRINITY_DN204_c0_g1_i3:55-834(+)
MADSENPEVVAPSSPKETSEVPAEAVIAPEAETNDAQPEPSVTEPAVEPAAELPADEPVVSEASEPAEASTTEEPSESESSAFSAKKRTHDELENKTASEYEPPKKEASTADTSSTVQYNTPEAYAEYARLQANLQASQRAAAAAAQSSANTSSAPPGVPVCNDFLRGVCHRLVCKYYHPPGGASAQHAANAAVYAAAGAVATPTGATLVAGQQVCRDFLKGTCHRAQCKFPHIATGSAGSSAGASHAAVGEPFAMLVC